MKAKTITVNNTKYEVVIFKKSSENLVRRINFGSRNLTQLNETSRENTPHAIKGPAISKSQILESQLDFVYNSYL